MALNLKNEEVHQLSRQLAALTGESLTTAVTVAVRERLQRVRNAHMTTEQRAERILELGRQIAAVMPQARIDVDDLYDERGLPA